MASKTERVQVSVRLPPEIHAEFKSLAKSHGVSVNAILTDLVHKWVRWKKAT